MPNQRDIVEVPFRLYPDGEILAHPIIVISNSEINEIEEGFLGVMMTTSEYYKDDDYSFVAKDNMFTKPLNKEFCAVRVHLVGNFLNTDIISNKNVGNQMKKEPFRRLLTHINNLTFGYNVFLDD